MIDVSSDRTQELSDRQNAAAEARRTFRAQPWATPRKGRLSAEEAAARRAAQSAQTGTTPGTLTVTTAAVQQVPRSAPPADPDAALRTGIRGVLTVAVLVLVFLWIRQRRRGVK